MRKLLHLLLFVILLAACHRDKSNANTDTTNDHTNTFFAQYYVRYLQEERQIKAHVAFFEGDSLPTARPVQFQGDVIFQGQPMQPRQLPPRTIRYLYNGVGDYALNSFIFQYQDNSGKTRQQMLQMAPIESFSVNIEASRSRGMELTVQTAPFQTDESLVLFFTNLTDHQSYTIEYKGLIDNPLLITPQEMGNITPGKYLLYLIKRQRMTNRSERTEITTEIEFYSKTIEIQIKK